MCHLNNDQKHNFNFPNTSTTTKFKFNKPIKYWFCFHVLLIGMRITWTIDIYFRIAVQQEICPSNRSHLNK